jgi:hypothetical protein
MRIVASSGRILGHYGQVNWFGEKNGRSGGGRARDAVSRRALLRRGGTVGAGALLGAAGVAIAAADGAPDPRQPVQAAGADGAANDLSRLVQDVRAHGAAGDGATDDTAAIQSALDAVGPEGGTVFLPAGRYRISATLVVRTHNTAMVGVGPGQRVGAGQDAVGTRIEAVGSLDDGPMLRVQLDKDTAPLHGVTLRDFALDGQRASGGSGVHFRSYRGLISHVFVYNVLGHGFDFQGYPDWDTYDTVVAFSQASRCGGSGFYLGEGATDLHFTSCVVFDNQDNMQLAGGGSAQVTGCHFYAAARHNIFFNGAGSRTKFANCKIEGADANGVLIDSTHSSYSDILFTGCNFASNGRKGDNLYDHIAITGPAENVVNRTVISGCTFSTKSGSPVARNFIGIGPSGRQTTIVGNNFGPPSHYGTGVVADEGARANPSVIRANGGLLEPDAALIRKAVHTMVVAGPNIVIDTDDATHTMTVSSSATVRTITSDTVLAVTDDLVRVNSEYDLEVTVPSDSTAAVPVGTTMRVRRVGAGEVALTAEPGVKLSGRLDRVERYSSYTLTKVYADQWDVES